MRGIIAKGFLSSEWIGSWNPGPPFVIRVSSKFFDELMAQAGRIVPEWEEWTGEEIEIVEVSILE